MSKRASVMNWLLAIVVLAAAVIAAMYLARRGMQVDDGPQPTMVIPPAASVGPPVTPATPAVSHPIDQARLKDGSALVADPTAADDSDADVLSELSDLAGDGLRRLLLLDQIVARLVATIDALPRQSLGNSVLPVHMPGGTLVTAPSDNGRVLSDQNALRYAPYVAVLEHVDVQALVRWYATHYAQFQRAYEQLGYPHGYFNDRLVAVIDNLLATPALTTPPVLLSSSVGYVYADSTLQSLSAGQKILLRIGPANAQTVKQRLSAIREALTAGQPALAPDPPATLQRK